MKHLGVEVCLLALFICILAPIYSEELSFELPDNERMCFNEVIRKGTNCFLEFQVIEGGNYDVDVTLLSPTGAVLYNEEKKQYDRYQWVTDVEGEYVFCFSNEFSTFTHKLVYFDFQAGEEDDPLKFDDSNPTAMTQMETSVLSIHRNLKETIDYQTHHRLKEAQGRSFAEDVNERVQYWSIGQTAFVVVAGIGYIIILKSFFTEKRPFAAST